MPKSTQLTKEYLDKKLRPLATKAHLDGLREEFSSDLREVVQHFAKSQAKQDARMDRRFDQIDGKLDAIMEMLATRRELQNLVKQLKAQGIKLNESTIFVS